MQVRENLELGKPTGRLVALTSSGMQLSCPRFGGNYSKLGALGWQKPVALDGKTRHLLPWFRLMLGQGLDFQSLVNIQAVIELYCSRVTFKGFRKLV